MSEMNFNNRKNSLDENRVALFDMDGTICDYVGSMRKELEKLRSPNESIIDPFSVADDLQFQYLWDRMEVIKADESWWANLPKFSLGLEVLAMTKELGYYNEILTQAPKSNPAALAGKLRWLLANIEEDIDFTMTRNKSRHYGRVLVDDFPDFAEQWLTYRKKGLVIMPANEYNKDFDHPCVIKYDGTNKSEVREGLMAALKR